MSIAMVGAKLVRSPGLTGDHVRMLLVQAAGDLERLCEPEVIARVQLPVAAQEFLRKPGAAELAADLDWVRASGARLLLWGGEGYPRPLAAIRSAPPALYVMGEVEALNTPQLAMVGARQASPAGKAIARKFAAALAQSGLTITSGLAIGIDAASHEGALSVEGRTVAVLGGGIACLYPPENAGLARRILAGAGALVSEFPPWTTPKPQNFPQRNRVISGLALGTLVVEAAEGSGSLITAQKAADQGREVFAVPGPVASPLSFGCHKLIQDGAQLVTGPADVLRGLQFHKEFQVFMPLEVAACNDRDPPSPLDKEYEMLLDALGFEPATIDTLVARCGLPGESIASMLLILELEGRIAPYPGGLYGRISR
jgi:DNA processing protein